MNPNQPDIQDQNIPIFIKLHSLPNFTKDRTTLRNIFNEHLQPTSDDKKIKILPYFKPTKLASFFSTRQPKPIIQQSRVVYQFSCLEEGCKARYVGYTTCTIAQRAQRHRYKTSSIYKHYGEDHNCLPPNPDNFCHQFSILHRSHQPTELRIAEALLIKNLNPFINVKFNEMSNFLNLYR